jgi:hypothetical protein
MSNTIEEAVVRKSARFQAPTDRAFYVKAGNEEVA